MPTSLPQIAAALFLAQTLPAATPISPQFFGVDQNNTRSAWPPTTSTGARAPVAALRLWDDGVKWSNIETCDPQAATAVAPADPANRCYTWTALDTWVRTQAPKAGVDVLYTLGGTPGFATSQVTPRTACETAGPYSCLAPVDVDKTPGSGLGDGTDATWINFLTALVARYKGQIQFYELWNEPDSPNFWSGNNAQFARMMSDAAAIIRSLDPAARILSPSFHGPTAATWFNTFLNGGGAPDFDIVNFHGRGGGADNIEPEIIITTNTQAQLVMASHGLTSRPLWDDEAGWLQNQVLDPDMQAAYVARSYILHASLGIARFYWYQWDSVAPYGLQGTIAGTAYAQIAHWLVGGTINACAKTGSVYNCPVTLSNGQQALIVWDALATCAAKVCTTTSSTAAPQYLQYLDVAGNTTPIQNNTVPIGAKPILLEAAIPTVVVDNAASYSSSLAPETIAVAFGGGLAATITVQDSAGTARAASLFYAVPQQSAFLIPTGTATGPAVVTIMSADGTVNTAHIQISAIAPALFSANASGQGPAAAIAVQNGSQIILELFGTGIRGATTPVTCTIGGVPAQVQYAGPQGSPGLDQVNVAIPAGLTGTLNIVLTVDGQTANAVTVNAGP